MRPTPPPEPLHDVVIIGAGAGGGATAYALASARLKVLVLDAGPAYSPFTDYLLDRPDWERERFPERPRSRGRHSFAELQTLDPRWDRLRSGNHLLGPLNHGDRRAVDEYQHVRGIGGSTLHFTGEAHRMHPAAMRMAQRFGVAADWPLDYGALEVFYAKAEELIGVAGPVEDPVRPRSRPCPLPPHRFSYATRRLMEGSRGLGLNLVSNNLAVLSRSYDGRPQCNYCNNCNRGCPRTDKGSVDVTFIRKAVATGRCEIRPETQVLALQAGGGDRVRLLRCVDAAGVESEISVRAVVVACGAIETPRLLLASASAQAPDGLANESGLVGRNLMETLSRTVIGLHPDPLGSWRGLPSDAICWDFNAPDAIPGVIGGCRLMPLTASMDLVGPINYAQRIVPGWGKAHKQGMRRSFGHALAFGGIGEFLPNAGTFVDLDPWESDEHGMPLARIHSQLTDMDLQRLAFMDEKSRQVLEAAGIDTIVEARGTYDFFSSSHVFGTCRIGYDAATSVLDPYCRSHRWRNLFVVDASVFPSSGGGESPSLTIEALALRTGAHIRDLAAAREI